MGGNRKRSLLFRLRRKNEINYIFNVNRYYLMDTISTQSIRKDYRKMTEDGKEIGPESLLVL